MTNAVQCSAALTLAGAHKVSRMTKLFSCFKQSTDKQTNWCLTAFCKLNL